MRQAGGEWRIHILAGGVPNGGETAADCESQLVGVLRGQSIHARAVPFEGEDIVITADDLAEIPGSVDIELTAGGLRVVKSTVEEHCGVGSDVRGVYLRSPKSRR